MVFLASILGLAVVIVPLALLRGWVLSLLWGWFIVPLGVPAVGVVHAIGIAFVVGMFTSAAKVDSDHPWRNIAIGFLAPLLTLAFGAIVHGFMG